MKDDDLIQLALGATKKVRAAVDQGKFSRLMGCVGSALETTSGDVFTGVCLEFYCSIGHCAEHSAISEMIKDGQSQIKTIVAITHEGIVIPPCGRCRELISQVDESNIETRVIVDSTTACKLRELIPMRWQDQFDASKVASTSVAEAL